VCSKCPECKTIHQGRRDLSEVAEIVDGFQILLCPSCTEKAIKAAVREERLEIGQEEVQL